MFYSVLLINLNIYVRVVLEYEDIMILVLKRNSDTFSHPQRKLNKKTGEVPKICV